MARIPGGQVVGRCFKKEDVKYLFYIAGGHIGPVARGCTVEGIIPIGVRDERGAAHAADGYARAGRTVGVCGVTAAVGLTNATTGMASAFADDVPMVVFHGRHSEMDDGRWALQEMHGVNMVEAITKWRACIHRVDQLAFFSQMAFRQALAPTPGPVMIESPYDVLAQEIEESEVTFTPPNRYRTEGRPMGDPVLIERAVDMLLAAERPLIMAGDGCYWSGVEGELQEFAELTQIPAYTARLGEGCLSEFHPLSVHRVVRSKMTRETDVVLSLGLRFWRGEGYGTEPSIWAPNYRLIQVDMNQARIGHNVSPEVGIVGDPKAVLNQMIECAKERIKSPRPADTPWLTALKERQAAFDAMNANQVKANWNNNPIHPSRLCHEVNQILGEDTIIAYDGMHTAAWAEQYVKASGMGQVLPLNLHGDMGAGVPWGLGAQLAQPKKRVIVMSGDGAFGIGAFELETAARYNLPIIVVVYNNNSWMGSARNTGALLPAMYKANTFQPDLRYDKLCEALGGYGEFVQNPDDIAPAMRRALDSGKPSVVNVMVDINAPAAIYAGQGTSGERKMKARFF